ncbi:UNVERIFIED_CONTAM: Protein FAM60A [Trichonephila clavipes]
MIILFKKLFDYLKFVFSRKQFLKCEQNKKFFTTRAEFLYAKESHKESNEDSLSESSSLSVPLSRVPSPSPSNSSDDSTVLEEPDEDMDQDIIAKKRRAKGIMNKIKKHRKTPCNNHKKSSFLDMTFWREERICCGVIFRGPHGEALIYPKLLRPCHCRRNGESANRFMSQGDGTSFLPNATNTATHVACSTGRNQFPNGISA